MSELNENINDVIDDATVITVPIDDTLTVSGEAADAYAVGQALALKADKSELAQSITVNGQAADLQGAILVNGTQIPMSGSDSTTVSAAVTAAAGRTGADIPLNSSAGAVTVAQAIANISSEGAQVEDNVLTLTGEITDTSYNVQGVKIGTTTLPVMDAAAVRSINNITPSGSGNVSLTTVDVARQLQSETAQLSEGIFIDRTAGGTASIADGDAWLGVVRGNSVHNGYVEESITAESSNEELEVTVTEDDFKTAAGTGGTYTFTYSSSTSAWSPAIASYGISVTGTPADADTITVVWVEGDRGEIVPADPQSFVATGWNLYNHTAGYARVLKYSDTYMFRVEGAYTLLQYSPTLNGARVNVTPVDGVFDITADGYLFVTGGSSSTTAIWMQQSDWTEEYEGSFESYSEDSVDLSNVMSTCFPNGLCSVGDVRDEININLGQAVQRIERMEYSAENLAAVIEAGRAYDADTDYIYAVLSTEVTTSIEVDGSYTVSDHGLEMWTGTDVAAYAQCLYGENLVDKLRTDVLTKSAQTLSSTEKTQVRTNIGAASAADLATKTATVATNWTLRRSGNFVYCSCVGGNYYKNSSNEITTTSATGTVCTIPEGYRPVSNCEMMATNPSAIRIYARTTGTFNAPNDTVSNTALRFSGCWFTTDNYPT